MTRRISLRPQAQDEFIDAVAWYEAQRAGLGTAFLLRFDELVERLSEFPLAARPLVRDVRIARVQRFPYSVVYRCRGDELRILAVFHLRRDPGRLPAR